MNWLKKGPELKAPEVKVPDFLFDLYYDLKERRLLPLVALLLVAIVAVPILIGRSGGSDSSAEEEAAVATPSSVTPEGDTLVVARSAPPLRDYRRRLRHARALDPFVQKFSGEGEGAGQETTSSPQATSSVEASGSVSSGGAEIAAPTIQSSPPSSAVGEAPTQTEPGSGSSEEGKARYASTTVDVRITAVPSGEAAGASAKPQAQVRRGLPELTMLPSRKVPAAVFMGTTADGKKALLLVSSDVESIFGDGQCVVGSKTCQLLALETGLPETFVYGPQSHTYRIEILKITKQVSAKPDRASLGSSKKKSQQAIGKQPEHKTESGAAG